MRAFAGNRCSIFLRVLRGWCGSRSKVGGLLLVICLCTSIYAQTPDGPKAATGGQAEIRVRHVMGLEGVKRNATGTLSFQSGGLNFQAKGVPHTVTIASIQDVSTSQDSHQVGGKVLTVAKMGVPYGGGRVLSLFSHEKFDSLTVQYRDNNGGLHGAIFTMPMGQASAAKQELIALGAHATTPVESKPEKPEAEGAKQ
jgi:hypothetical protein